MIIRFMQIYRLRLQLSENHLYFHYSQSCFNRWYCFAPIDLFSTIRHNCQQKVYDNVDWKQDGISPHAKCLHSVSNIENYNGI